MIHLNQDATSLERPFLILSPVGQRWGLGEAIGIGILASDTAVVAQANIWTGFCFYRKGHRPLTFSVSPALSTTS
jgi:hypothetical protein